MAGNGAVFVVAFLALMAIGIRDANAEIPAKTQAAINSINRQGPWLGVIIPNTFEMNPLLSSPSYSPSTSIPNLDFAGRRFRFGNVEGKKVVLVMTGLGMINAGVTTQLLLDLFKLEGVVHYGIAGNADPSLHIGDVTIPAAWAHTALWNWQRSGDGPANELPLEVNGDYTRKIGYLKFADYTTQPNGEVGGNLGNLLNNVWYQPEEVFPVNGKPEERSHRFWVTVDPHYFKVAKSLQNLKLEGCVNATTCLPYSPRVTTVSRGASASIYLDNAAYRAFLHGKFKVSPVDMESASVALICFQQRVPFVAIRALSDLAGGGSAESNEANTFTVLAAKNSITVVVEFIKRIGLPRDTYDV